MKASSGRHKRISRKPRTHRVLLVSTDPSDYAMLSHILDGDQWTVRRTPSCRQAAISIHELPPAVVICQTRLPDGSWRSLLRDVLETDVPPRLIVLSRVVDDALWAEVLNLGGYDVLPRPLDPKEVSYVISMALRHRIHGPVASKRPVLTRLNEAADRVDPKAAVRQTEDL